MPEFLYNHHIWWLDFWSANPLLFWSLVGIWTALMIWRTLS